MRLAFLAFCALAACVAAEPEAKPYYWKLVAINGQPYAATATLAFDDSGDRAFGQAPCNSWSGRVVRQPFPETNIRDVTATKMACPDLAAEQAFFDGLAKATHEAVGIGYLQLTDTRGFTMDFVPLAD